MKRWSHYALPVHPVFPLALPSALWPSQGILLPVHRHLFWQKLAPFHKPVNLKPRLCSNGRCSCPGLSRSEERRVGKDGKSRKRPNDQKINTKESGNSTEKKRTESTIHTDTTI